MLLRNYGAIDIDCPIWHLSKITTWLIINSLKDHGIDSISVKFSGNKGFHIGIPFEAFKPNKEIKNEFPELPRKIALYLLDFIGKKYIKIESNEIKFGRRFKVKINKLSKAIGKNIDDLSYWYCNSCKKKIERKHEEQEEFIVKSEDIDFINESSYKDRLKKTTFKKKLCSCKNPQYIRLFNPASIIDIDTILISSRHLYRMPYSLHEKSGLVSLPIKPEKILDFNKEFAQPNKVKVSKFRFLDKKNIRYGEGKQLLEQALSFIPEEEKEEKIIKKEYETLKSALPEQLFPPCIKKLSGQLKDGRKRALFILTNFLTSVGWNYDDIEKYINEWNKKLEEPLRPTYIKGQLRYHKQHKKKILPPNCDNQMYYKDIGVCYPDNLCQKIKNPVNYSRRKVFFSHKNNRK